MICAEFFDLIKPTISVREVKRRDLLSLDLAKNLYLSY